MCDVSMNSFRTKLIAGILGYGCVLGAVVGAVLYYGFPAYFTNWYYGILAFFLVVEPLVLVYIENESRTATDRQLVNSYMLTKVVKTVAVLGLIVIYYAVVGRENLKSFVIVLLIFYFLFLVVETFFFTKIEKRLKEKQQQDE